MQQKVQFLASVIHRPELIILDEPFSGLDPVNAMLLNRIITELHEEGRTILFSTHILHQAERMCDRIILIDNGVKILDDSLENIRNRFDPHTITVEPIQDMQGFATKTKDVPGVESITIDEEGRIHALITQGHDQAATMKEILAISPVRSIELGRTNLDEVFVRLVSDSSRPKEVACG